MDFEFFYDNNYQTFGYIDLFYITKDLKDKGNYKPIGDYLNKFNFEFIERIDDAEEPFDSDLQASICYLLTTKNDDVIVPVYFEKEDTRYADLEEYDDYILMTFARIVSI